MIRTTERFDLEGDGILAILMSQKCEGILEGTFEERLDPGRDD